MQTPSRLMTATCGNGGSSCITLPRQSILLAAETSMRSRHPQRKEQAHLRQCGQGRARLLIMMGPRTTLLRFGASEHTTRRSSCST